MTNVLIVEDQAMPRQLFEMYVNTSENYRLVKSIRSAELAFGYCAGGGVDLILMDVCTELDASGLDASERIKAAFPRIKIIIVTSIPEFSWLERARAIGVDSFWYKEVSRVPLLELMDRTMAGEHIYPDATPEVSLGAARSGDFTRRELEVLRELTAGASNIEIGEALNLSELTVRGYITRMLQKTGFRNRTELAVEARRIGIVVRDGEAPE